MAADGRPGLIQTADGKWHPALGYTWVAPDDSKNLEVKVRPDLWLDHYDSEGRPTFVPRIGYTWVDPQQLTTRVWAGLRLTGVDAAGNSWFVPAPGYVWDGDPQKTNLRIKVRPDLRVAATGLDGIGVSFWAAPGYVWAGDPNTLVTKVRPDLRIHHFLADGSASFIPGPAYMWVGEPNNLVTRLKPHIELVETDANGEPVFKAAFGYRWVNPDDSDNFDVEMRPGIVDNGHGFSLAPGYAWLYPEDQSDLSVIPAPGFVWASSEPRDLRIRVADRGDAHPGIGGNGGGGAKRSPAMDPELEHDLQAAAIQAARIGAGSAIGGVAGELVNGSPVGVIVGGLLSSTPTAGPETDMTHQPGEPHGGNGGGGGSGGGGNGGGGNGGGPSEVHHEGAGSFR